ncbi:DMT family transporter [Millisia brevis]|uniref:DMT family transporter n=1 Tax=Millisia brevis TaxID=264148 RepID=UPI00082FF8AC|nr:EamA family transporter [Millisia brevis]
MTTRGIYLILALGVIWGIPYALIKIAVVEMSPQMLVLVRTGLAAAILLPIAARRGVLRPLLTHWRPLLAYTLAEIMLPWYFINSAEQRLPSSTAGLLLASVPLAGVAIAFLMGRAEPMQRQNWLGLAIGFAGVGALVGVDIAGSDLIGVAEMSVAVVGYAIGPALLARYLSAQSGLAVAAASLAIAAIVYLPIVLLTDGIPTTLPSTGVIAAVVVLAVVCSALAFLLLFALVGEVGPVRATVITYLNPAVAVTVGALWLGERITVWTLVGFVLVLSGSFLVTYRRRLGGDTVDVVVTGTPAVGSPAER